MIDNGSCSLREAIESANTNSSVSGCVSGSPFNGANEVQLVAGTTYNLTLPGTEGGADASFGDLDVTNANILLDSAGNGSKVVQTLAGNRVIDCGVFGFTVSVWGLPGGTVSGDGGGIRKTGAGTLSLLNTTLD